MAEISTNQQQVSAETVNERLKSGPVDLSHLPRAQRLELINEVLALNSLRPLEGLGDQSQGQIEFVGINAITPDPVRPGAFVTRVDFQCNKPQGEAGGYNHLSFFNAGTTLHSGVVILPVVNDEFILMVQQYRPVLGKNTIEIPRGFVADLGDPNAIKSYGAALKELSEETAIDLKAIPHTVRKEFSLPENSGTSNIVNAILVIDIHLPQEQIQAVQSRIVMDADNLDHQLKTLLVPINEVKAIAEDNHTAAALFKGL